MDKLYFLNKLDVHVDLLFGLTGLACCAKYSVDQCWYRGEILSVGHGPDKALCAVLLVDYGSLEYVETNRCTFDIFYYLVFIILSYFVVVVVVVVAAADDDG